MLPVVVIGADDSVRQAFETWNTEQEPCAVLFYETAEDAQAELPDSPAVGQSDDGWACTVVYGPLAFGALVSTGEQARLRHTGWTVLAGANLQGNVQHLPRRVRDGVVLGEQAETLVWEASARVSTNFLVDVSMATGDGSLEKLAAILRDRPSP